MCSEAAPHGVKCQLILGARDADGEFVSRIMREFPYAT